MLRSQYPFKCRRKNSPRLTPQGVPKYCLVFIDFLTVSLIQLNVDLITFFKAKLEHYFYQVLLRCKQRSI